MVPENDAPALERARAGDGQAFRELVDPYLRELQVHCYRILGSVQDAEDLLQETLLGAWRGLAQFENRASLRVWLYRIATNRCLNTLRDKRRRPQEYQAMVEPPQPTRRSEPVWLEPYPDVLLDGPDDNAPGPEARYEASESIALTFVAALQHLPPRQRCALVLRDVLGFRAAETAGILDTTEASVKRSPAAGTNHAPRTPSARRPGPRSGTTGRPARRDRRTVRHRRRERRHRRRRRPLVRRRLAHHAPRALRVPRPGRHRPVRR
jgi:RNA polymerase sigma-70 factor, ECF subfamily